MVDKCLRCNRNLYSLKSKELGYGKKCYRIHLLEQNKQQINVNELKEIRETLELFKCEFSMIKNQLRALKTVNIINSNEKVDKKPKERTNKESMDNELQELNKPNMSSVVKEMKELFKNIKSVKELLIHIEIKKE